MDAVTVRRATDDELTEIKRLTHDEYLRRGLIRPQADRMFSLYQQFDGIKETIPLVAVDGDRIVGTMSITLDSERGLPGEDDYPVEIAAIRSIGIPLGAVWRLAVERGNYEHWHSAAQRLMYVGSQEMVDRGEPIMLHICHPRHATYYGKRLGFRQVAARYQTHGLTAAPSVLMVGGPGSYSRILGG